jgi:hypothetical protein
LKRQGAARSCGVEEPIPGSDAGAPLKQPAYADVLTGAKPDEVPLVEARLREKVGVLDNLDRATFQREARAALKTARENPASSLWLAESLGLVRQVLHRLDPAPERHADPGHPPGRLVGPQPHRPRLGVRPRRPGHVPRHARQPSQGPRARAHLVGGQAESTARSYRALGRARTTCAGQARARPSCDRQLDRGEIIGVTRPRPGTGGP